MGADKRPEELINYYVKARVSVRKIANASGFIALLWSTVVLLGGFVSILRVKDFWLLSVLSLLMASKMLEIWDSRIGGIYVPEKQILRLTKGQDQLVGDNDWLFHWTCIVILSMAVAVKIILMFCIWAITCASPHMVLVLSAARLIQRDYGDAGGDAANKAKLNAALIIFYVLVIFQSLSFSYYAFLTVRVPWMLLSKQFGFGIWGPKIVRKYQLATRGKCDKDGFLPNNWNIITFSVGLLESATPSDRLWGARVLDTSIGKGIPIRQELLSSSQAIQNLIGIIGLTSTDNREIRERAARIVADLASELRIAQFPNVLRCIFCLLESCNQYSNPEVAHPSENSDRTLDKTARKVSVQTFDHGRHQEDAHLSLAITDDKQVINLVSSKLPNRRSWAWAMQILMCKTTKEVHEHDIYFGKKYTYSYVSKGTKELISQGLIILERLTQDEENCIEIIKNQRLLSKITLPLIHQDFLRNGCGHTCVEMLSSSLTVVSRLISVEPTEDIIRLRHDMSRNVVVIRNLMLILEVDSECARELHEQAIEILTELALDDSFRKLAFDESASMIEMFVKRLQRIFLEDSDNNAIVAKQDEEKGNTVRRKAGEALARLLRIPSARDNVDALTSTANVNAIDLLSKQDMIDLLTKVVNQILSSKVEKAADVVMPDGSSNNFHVKMVVESQPPNGVDTRQSSSQKNEEQSEERKLLAAMLSLTLAICNSNNVINGDEFTRAIPDDATVVKKLKEIVDTNMDATTEGWGTQKLVCQVIIAMVQLKPSYTREFNEHNLKEALSKALETLSDVDNCMLFAGDDHKAPARSLTSLVKEAQELLAQEQGDTISA